MDKETKREIILDNYQHPTNRGLKEDKSYVKANTRSDSCIDNIDLMMKIEDGKIVDACFDGEACAICTSATSIIVKSLIGKSVKEAKEIISNYQNMINEKNIILKSLENLMFLMKYICNQLERIVHFYQVRVLLKYLME